MEKFKLKAGRRCAWIWHTGDRRTVVVVVVLVLFLDSYRHRYIYKDTQIQMMCVCVIDVILIGIWHWNAHSIFNYYPVCICIYDVWWWCWWISDCHRVSLSSLQLIIRTLCLCHRLAVCVLKFHNVSLPVVTPSSLPLHQRHSSSLRRLRWLDLYFGFNARWQMIIRVGRTQVLKARHKFS